jgi:hypothetical protein
MNEHRCKHPRTQHFVSEVVQCELGWFDEVSNES